MRILAIDTAGPRSAVLLVEDGQVLALRDEAMERGHAEALVPMVADVMAAAGADWASIDRIAVIAGPGSFTGVRIGVAAARGLALASGAACIGVSALEALAWSVDAVPPGGVLIGNDARRGQVFAQTFGADGSSLGPPVAATPETVLSGLPAATRHVTGTGAGLMIAAADAADRDLGDLEIVRIDLAAVCRHAAGFDPAAHPPVPLYLRPPDAKPQASARIARAP